MSPRGEALRRTEREILAEKAAALGRAGERLEDALREVGEVAARWRAAHEPHVCARLADEYESARKRAVAARLALVIQREALGLRNQRVVDQEFPEPPRRPR